MGQMPQGVDRRMVLQMLAHWRELRGDRAFPSFENVDPRAIPLNAYPDGNGSNSRR